MSLGIRRLLVLAVGAVMAVYGAASLTGGWLGTPPWARDTPADTNHSGATYGYLEGSMFDVDRPNEPPGFSVYTPPPPELMAASRRSRLENVPRLPGWCSVGLGLALVAVGAWPRRRAGTAS